MQAWANHYVTLAYGSESFPVPSHFTFQFALLFGQQRSNEEFPSSLRKKKMITRTTATMATRPDRVMYVAASLRQGPFKQSAFGSEQIE